jgi:hypothetical protein
MTNFEDYVFEQFQKNKYEGKFTGIIPCFKCQRPMSETNDIYQLLITENQSTEFFCEECTKDYISVRKPQLKKGE